MCLLHQFASLDEAQRRRDESPRLRGLHVPLRKALAAVLLLVSAPDSAQSQGPTIQHAEVGLDLSISQDAADSTNLLSTTTGKQVGALAQDGVFLSRSITVPIASPSPFLAVTAVWAVENPQPSPVTVDVRSSRDGVVWTDWESVPPDADASTDAHESVGGLLFLSEETTLVQFRVTLPHGTGKPSTLTSFRAVFISPGKSVSTLAQSSQSSPTPLAVAKPPVVTRTGWGCPDGQSSPNWTPQYTTVTHLIVHHTVDSNSHPDWPAVVRSIFTLHKVTNGWGDIGYNYLVDPNGIVYEGRAGGDNVIGAHFSCANSNTMGIAFLGTFTSVQPSQAALNAARQLLAWKAQQRGIDPEGSTYHPSTGFVLKNISGHKDANGSTVPSVCDKNTQCPGTVLYSMLIDISKDVAALIGGGQSAPDLAVTVLTAPLTGTIGGQSSISASVTNSGTSGSGIYRLGFYFSTDQAITTGDTFSGSSCSMSALGIGGMQNCSGPIAVPGSLAPGTYYLGAIADDQSQVAELNELNNTRSVQITLSGPPDTTAPTVSVFNVSPSTTTLGQSFTINYTVSDSGGSGLNRVVLRRTAGNGSASDPGWQDIKTNAASGNGPTSSGFSDIPPSVGTYWYGMAAFDNSGNSKDERQSGLGPVQRTVVGADTTPDPFSFTVQTGVALGTTVTSNTITVSGINAAASISVSGGTYSINGGGYTGSGGTVNNGNTVSVRLTSAASNSTQTCATLTIGGVNGTFCATTLALVVDTTPDPFSFTAQTGVALSAAVTSNTITVSGINAAASISVSGGTYSINGGGYTGAGGAVNNGNTVSVRLTSAASNSTQTCATLTIGGVNGTFCATTLVLVVDTTPDPFSFTVQTGVALSATVTSNTITVSGINAATSISVSGGTYNINGGGYTGSAGTVNNGNTVSMRLTSAASNSTQTCATLTIGGVNGTFCATTLAFTTFPLTVSPVPTNGFVTATGISCGAGGSGDCTESYASGITATLTGIPASDFLVGTWTGCTPINNNTQCTVQMTQARTVTVTFVVTSAPHLPRDFNGDRKADILWRNSNAGQIFAWLMNGASVSGAGSLGGVTSDWVIVGVGDFDGDGKADILWRNTTSGVVYIWLMNGTSVSGAGSLGGVTLDWVIAGVGDFNGDGKADILWQNTTSGVVYIWLMNGTSVSGAGSLGSVTLDWVIAGVGDFNGDGKADILWRNTASGVIFIWFINGTSISSAGLLGGVTPEWVIAGVGDFNGDGKADILWRNSNTGQVFIWLMNGTSISSAGLLGGVTSDWVIVGVGDFNGDGKADILWRNTTSGVIFIWFINGTSVSTSGSPGGVTLDWVIQWPR